MANLTYAHTLTNGTTADADQVMANFNNVKTLVETTKFDHANLQYDQSMMEIGRVVASINEVSGDPLEIRFKLPTAHYAFEPVTAYLQAHTIGGSHVYMMVKVGATSAMAANLDATSEETLVFTESFSGLGSFPAGSEVTFHLWVDSSTATIVSFGLFGKMKHVT